ncbi:MAG: hypothetical protein WCN87_03690 [Chlamydiota bacterium]
MKLQIPSRATKCHLDHAFENPIISQLFKESDGSWRRIDSCQKCSNSQGAYCTWESVSMPQKVESTPLLERFQASQESNPKELCFLAEILIRQKKLLKRSRNKKEQVLENAVTGELYSIPRCDLTLDEVQNFSDGLALSL